MKWAFAAIGSLAVLMACDPTRSGDGQGSASGSSGAGTGKDPCSLLTKEEVGQVMGMAVAGPTRDGSNCNYIAPDATNGSATISATWEKTEAEAKADYGATAGATSIGNQIPGMSGAGGAVAGLGDEASFAMYFLHVRKGNALLQVNVSLPNRLVEMVKQGQAGPAVYSAAVLEMEKALAAKALTKL
jgi:hypothetical protein